jgi:hypothetical protein
MPWRPSTHQQLKTRTSLAITTATFELQILKINNEIYNLKSRSRSSAGPQGKDRQQRHDKKDIKAGTGQPEHYNCDRKAGKGHLAEDSQDNTIARGQLG